MEILTIAMDDDQDDLMEMKARFDEAGIHNYKLCDREKDFLASLTKEVRIVIIDHYIRGEGVGVELMQKVKDNDLALAKLIPTRIIIISGQKRSELMRYYSSHGADYLNKNEEGFWDNLVHFVKKNYADVEFKLKMAEAQLKHMEEVTELLKIKEKNEPGSLENNR